MSKPSISVPLAGQPNSTEDPKIATSLTNIKTWVDAVGLGLLDADIAIGANVDASKLLAGSVTTTQLSSTATSEAVNTANIRSSAVTTAKIADANVTTDKLASVAVSRSKLRAFTVPVYVTVLPPTVTGTATWTLGDVSLVVSTSGANVPQVGQGITGTGVASDTVITSVTGSVSPFTLGISRPTTAAGASTALTVAPQDGDEVYYLADSATRTLWHLRYNTSSSSAYKWEFLGGPSVQALTGGTVTSVTTNWSFAPTIGPVVTGVPLAGDYEVTLGAYLVGVTSTTAAMYVSTTSPTTLAAAISGTGTGTITVANGDLITVGDTLYVEGSTPAEQMTVSAVAGNTITISARGTNGTTAQSHTTGANVYALALSSANAPTRGILASLTAPTSGSRTINRTGVPSGGKFAVAYRIGGSATTGTISELSVGFRPVRVG